MMNRIQSNRFLFFANRPALAGTERRWLVGWPSCLRRGRDRGRLPVWVYNSLSIGASFISARPASSSAEAPQRSVPAVRWHLRRRRNSEVVEFAGEKRLDKAARQIDRSHRSEDWDPERSAAPLRHTRLFINWFWLIVLLAIG